MWYVIALVCAALFGWLGYRLSKGRRAVAVGGVVLGLALVFYWPWREVNPTRRLTPLVHIEVPADFGHSTVFIIPDAEADAEIVWSDDNQGRIVSPKSGIIRVKALGPLDNQNSRAMLSDGRTDWGLLNGNLGSVRIVVYDFAQVSSEPQVDNMSDEELTRYIRTRELE